MRHYWIHDLGKLPEMSGKASATGSYSPLWQAVAQRNIKRSV